MREYLITKFIIRVIIAITFTIVMTKLDGAAKYIVIGVISYQLSKIIDMIRGFVKINRENI